MLTGAGLIVLGLAGMAWGFRLQIGAALARGYLGAQGVESEVVLQGLSLHGFSGRLRLGPAADPDATVDRVDVDLTIGPPWGPAPLQVIVRRIRLLRPTLNVRLDGRGLRLGKLQRLIDLAESGASATPTPDLTIADGRVTLITPAGVVRMRGSGTLGSGRPVSMNLHLGPARLAGEGWSAQTGEGVVTLGPSTNGVAARAEAPVVEAHWPGAAITGAAAELTFIGAVSDPGRPLRLRGRAQARLHVAAAMSAGQSFEAASTNLDLSRLEVAMDGSHLSFVGIGVLDAATSKFGLNGPAPGGVGPPGRPAGVILSGVAVQIRELQIQADLDRGRWRATSKATLRAQAGEARALGGAASPRLLDPTWVGEGRLELTPGGLVAALAGGAKARGVLTRADAARLTAGVEHIAGAEAQARTLRAALADFRFTAPALRFDIAPRRLRLSMSAPVRLAAANGVHLSLGPGAAITRLKLPEGRIEGASVISAGGGGLPSAEIQLDQATFANGAFDGRFAAGIAADAGPLHRATLSGAGRAHVGADMLRFSTSGCLAFAADRLTLGDDELSAPSGRLCAAPATPLFTADAAGWRADGRIEDVQLASRLYGVGVRDLAGTFAASGLRARQSEAVLHLGPALVTDQATPKRFTSVSVVSDVQLARAHIKGRLAIAAASGESLGTVRLLDDLSRGDGSAVIDAPNIRFVRGGLQPVDLSPVAGVLRSVQGPARFNGEIAWAQSGKLTSSGELAVDGLDLASSAGAVTGLRAKVHFTGLIPPTTTPGQVLTVQSIEAPVALHDLRLMFGLEPAALQIQSAQLGAADGLVRLEPMRIALDGGGLSNGVLTLSGLDLGKLVAASNLADKIRLEAVVDGRLPFQVGPTGLTLLEGRLAAVRPGRLSIQREVLVGAAQPNAVQDFAYQALGDLAFDVLDATVDSRPAGRLGVIFHIKGRYDPAVGREAYVGVRQLIDGTAFQKSIPLPKGTGINLTLDSSLNFNQLIADYQTAFDFGRAAAAQDRSGAVQP